MFANRQQAGKLLARKLSKYKRAKDTLILSIPRGGVVVGKALADQLDLPHDIVVVKKLGAPGNPELAIGAVAAEGVRIIDAPLALRVGADQEYLDEETRRKRQEVAEKIKRLRVKKEPLDIANKTVIVTDDGIATGATTEAAIAFIKKKKPKKIVLAVPVAPPEAVEKFEDKVDELVILEKPAFFTAVGQFYEEFGQVSDEQARELLSH